VVNGGYGKGFAGVDCVRCHGLRLPDVFRTAFTLTFFVFFVETSY